MKSGYKENVQYITAIIFLFSGILICFLSFFLNEYDIRAGALTYLGEGVAFCSGVFSINLYVRHKVNEAEMRLSSQIDQRMHEIEEEQLDEHNKSDE